jgi:hypothetical protein
MGIQAATTWQQIYKPQLAAHGDFKIKFHKNSKRRWTSISSQNAMIAVEEALNTTMRTIAALLTIRSTIAGYRLFEKEERTTERTIQNY